MKMYAHGVPDGEICVQGATDGRQPKPRESQCSAEAQGERNGSHGRTVPVPYLRALASPNKIFQLAIAQLCGSRAPLSRMRQQIRQRHATKRVSGRGPDMRQMRQACVSACNSHLKQTERQRKKSRRQDTLHPMRGQRVHCLEPQHIHVHDQPMPVWPQRIRYGGRGRARKTIVRRRSAKREACVQVLPRSWNSMNSNHENLPRTGGRERVHMRIRDGS
jgi:hypothetical protein